MSLKALDVDHSKNQFLFADKRGPIARKKEKAGER